MKNYLVTGPAGFLGYHVIKRLNDDGLTPRALLPRAGVEERARRSLDRLKFELVEGDVNDMPSLRAACAGVDAVLHLNFLINLGGGPEVEESLRRVNVEGTRNVLDAAAEAGAQRVVVSSSSLAVGLNRRPEPLDETADWSQHGFDLAYAVSRRTAELEALARPASDGPTIVAVNPSFTMGPEDFVGAPANGLVQKMTKRWFRFIPPIGFGVLDVRDYADGVMRAVERGRHGQRYILSGENVQPDQLLNEVAATIGAKPVRRWLSFRAGMASPVIEALELWSRVRGQSPKVTRSLLQLWNRYAWYDTSLARRELGWQSRPLRETLADALRDMPQSAGAPR